MTTFEYVLAAINALVAGALIIGAALVCAGVV